MPTRSILRKLVRIVMHVAFGIALSYCVGVVIGVVSARGMQPWQRVAIYDDGDARLWTEAKGQYALLPDVPLLGRWQCGLVTARYSVGWGSLASWEGGGWMILHGAGTFGSPSVDVKLERQPETPFAAPPMSARSSVEYWCAGVPFPSVCGFREHRLNDTFTLVERQSSYGLRWDDAWASTGPLPSVLGNAPRLEPIPYAPSWPGLVADGVVVAIALTVCRAIFITWPRAWRRARRRVQGRCPACGHPTEPAGTTRCPECGADVSRSLAAPSPPSNAYAQRP